MELKTLINKYLRLQGAYPLTSDDPIIKIKFNDDIVIAFEESLDPAYFTLFSVIDTLTNKGELLESITEALSANLFHKETGDASIGYDKTTKALILFQKVKFEHMDELKLQEIIVPFLGTLAYQKDKFEKIGLLHTL